MKAVYIHIPFCKQICSYCDFPKMLYCKKWIVPYLESLQREIEFRYQGEEIETLYIGGGTPSTLSVSELQKLLQIAMIFKKKVHCEYTIECNVDSLTEEKLKLMKQYGVNRLSIGVQTFQQHYLKQMNRSFSSKQLKKYITLARKLGFQNINLDLMYALPNETIDILKEDLRKIVSFKPEHISTYSLMIEPHTIFGIQKIKPIAEEVDAFMYQTICEQLKKEGYQHYEISNFALSKKESKHNLTYWNNEPYYGFGLGASGYIDTIRYTNTCSILAYQNGIYEKERDILSIKEMMEYEMILGLRKMEGVSESLFFKKYGKTIEEVFPIEPLLQEGKLILENQYLKIPSQYWYTSNDILIYFVGGDL